MKLAGPKGIGVRLVVGLRETRGVVTGVFPPERAPEHRPSAERLARKVTPIVNEALDKLAHDWRERILYGDPQAKPPVGILRGESWIGPIARRLPPCPPGFQWESGHSVTRPITG